METATDIAHLIASSLAPVFLLTGVAAMLSVLTNRLARIVDRARKLEDRLESRTGKTKELHADLLVLARRARYINVAISLCAVAAVMVAAVVVTLFANAFFGFGFASAFFGSGLSSSAWVSASSSAFVSVVSAIAARTLL